MADNIVQTKIGKIISSYGILLAQFPTYESVSAGLIDGLSMVNKFGRNPDIDTAATESVWNGGGTYTGFPNSAEKVSVFSNSANDTLAGTGARSITIVGLSPSFQIISETLVLNGLTPVVSTQDFIRVHTARIVSAGSSGVNAGSITGRQNVTVGNIFFVIPIGNNQTSVAAYTIPAGHTAYMSHLGGAIRGGVNASVIGSIWTRTFGEVFRGRRPFVISTNNKLVDAINGGLVFTEKSDIDFRITTDTNNTDVTVNFDLLLVKNELFEAT